MTHGTLPVFFSVLDQLNGGISGRHGDRTI